MAFCVETAPVSDKEYKDVFPCKQAPSMSTFSHDGKSMAVHRWQCASGDPSALVVLVHGFGEHLGRYGHVANFFINHGYSVIGIDHVCHGLSDGMEHERGCLKSFDVLLENWRAFILKEVQSQSLKTVVYAHSTGGLVAFLALAESRWYKQWSNLQGVVLSAPLLRSPKCELYICPHVLLKCLKCLRCCGTSPAIPAVTGDQISTYKPAVDATKADSLYWGWKINLSFVRAMLEGSVRALSLLPEVDFPFLVMHAPEDKLCDVSGSSALYEQAKTPAMQKEMEVDVFAGCAHELHNEEDWQKPLLLAHDFIQRGCKKKDFDESQAQDSVTC